MDYANTTNTLLTKSYKKKMQRLKNRALNIIYDCRGDLEELHCLAKLTSLWQRRDKQLLNLMYRCSLNQETYQQLLYPFAATRASPKIRFDIPKPNLERFKSFPLYSGAQLWDQLSADTQRAPNPLYFKSRIPKTPDFAAYPVR